MYEIIQTLCKSNGITVTALCEKITGSKGNLSTWKKNNIRNDYLVKISEYFNVSTDYLLGNEQKEKSLPPLSDKDREAMELFEKLPAHYKDIFIQLLKDRLK
jgi:transcriptional regulator with XRE-family HTH domain